MSDLKENEGNNQRLVLRSGSVKSATRVLDLFELLGRWSAARTHAEINEELGIPKSSLTSLLRTLTDREYLKYVPETKAYILGASIAKLAQSINNASDLIGIAKVALQRIKSETDETSALNILQGDFSKVAASEMSTQRLGYFMRVDDIAPLYATSGGKVILAHMPEDMIMDYLDRVQLESILPKTITSAKVLLKQLKQIRNNGVAYAEEEYALGIQGISVPILDTNGIPLASINVAVPLIRFSSERKKTCEASLKRAAKMVEQKINSSK